MVVLERTLIDNGPYESLNEPIGKTRSRFADYRASKGMARNSVDLLTWPSHQPKAGKSVTPTYVLHLAPSDVSGYDTCPWATKGCRDACLNTAGRGRFDTVQNGRILKTQFLAEHTAEFLTLLRHEIELAMKRHADVAIRLNGTSDLPWHEFASDLFTMGPRFYDYTKRPRPTKNTPDDYSLTYSWHENSRDIVGKVAAWQRVAVVFDTARNANLPPEWRGVPVVDADKDDQRWQDNGVICGLRAKGDAIGDTSGFVQDADVS